MLNINKIISNIIQFEYTKHFNYEKKVKNNYTDVMSEDMMDIPTEFNKKDIFSTNQIKLSSIFLKKTGKTIKRTNDNLSKNTDIKLQIERNQSYKTIIYISLCLLQWKPRFLEKENTPILRFTFGRKIPQIIKQLLHFILKPTACKRYRFKEEHPQRQRESKVVYSR